MEERELEAARLLAQCLVNVGKHVEAADILRAVVKADPGDYRARRCLVSAALAAGDYKGAEPHAVFLVETTRGEERIPALFFLAHAMWGMGNAQACRRAVEQYKAALAEHAAGDDSEARKGRKI